MGFSQFIIEGYCQGAYPVDSDNLEEISSETWYNELIDAIRSGDDQTALRIAEDNFVAEYNTESIQKFESDGVRYIRTLATNLNLPYVENDGSSEIPLFKWVGAHFLMEAPTEVVSQWLESDENGKQSFSQMLFEEWLGDDDRLQDGCYYALGTCWYDLEGYGENGGSIDASSVIAGLDQELKLSEEGLLSRQDKTNAKKAEMLSRLPSKDPLVGNDLMIIYELLEEESPIAERRANRQECVEKWARLSGYKSASAFLEAIFEL